MKPAKPAKPKTKAPGVKKYEDGSRVQGKRRLPNTPGSLSTKTSFGRGRGK